MAAVPKQLSRRVPAGGRTPRFAGSLQFAAVLALALTLAACGSQHAESTTTQGAAVVGHPQVVEPIAGVAPSQTTGAGTDPVGDPNAHATPLSEVKRELRELNLCGGTTNAADATPVSAGSGPGFVPDPGTVQNVGQLPELTSRLNELAKSLGVTIYGISGYRSPSHSVAVGGSSDDPHTRGEAEDIGVNSLLRSSAAQISEADLAEYGLYRPFDPSDNPANTEVNHIQLIEAGGAVPLPEAQAEFAPDPSCT